MRAASLLHPFLAVVLAPLLPAVIARVKAWAAGRRGPSLLQPWLDLAKLARKGTVYGTPTTWMVRTVPVASVGTGLLALLLLPAGGVEAALAFPGDLLFLPFLLAAGRFFTVLGALDTGSSFEGMGASRDVAFSALAEPALFLSLAGLARATGEVGLSGALPAVTPAAWAQAGPAFVLLALAILAVLLTECSRIPVDDPSTHLELTMIHEVMVLDHSGPDLALVHYGSALKLWAIASVLVGLTVPVRTGAVLPDLAAHLAGMALAAALVGLVESSMARLRLIRVPQFLVGAAAFAALALILLMRARP